jgi:hypothetical protein
MQPLQRQLPFWGDKIVITMKKSTFLFAIALCFSILNPFHTQAQWYKSYGVASIDELTEAQCKAAMGKAENTRSLGTGVSVVGGLCAAGGGITFILAKNYLASPSSQNIGDPMGILLIAVTGQLLMYVGAGIAAIGMPIWIHGTIRKSQIKRVLNKFPAKVSLLPMVSKDFNWYYGGLKIAVGI